MGMSSSQARLLTLTARMHDIEYKAQRLEAQKLQMANESRRAYDDYLIALESSKIQYKTLNSNGSVTYRDVNLNILENGVIKDYDGEKAPNPLFLQRQDGTILLTPDVAREYGVSSASNPGEMDDYIHDVTGKNKIMVDVLDHYEDVETNFVESVTPVENTKIKDDSCYLNGFTPFNNFTNLQKVNYTDFQIVGEPVDTTNMPDLKDGFNNSFEYKISDLEGLLALKALCESGAYLNKTFYLANDIDMSQYTDVWTGIEEFYGVFDGNYHTISNLGVGGGATSGLFASTKKFHTVEIKNLKLENVNITGSERVPVGGLVSKVHHAYSEENIISNCVVTGTITALEHVGGIVGEVSDSDARLRIENTNSDIQIYLNENAVSNYMCIGGIVGHCEGTLNIDECRANGEISGFRYSGGIVGHNQVGSNSTITDSVSNVKIDSKDSSGSIIGYVERGTGYDVNNVIYDPALNPGRSICGGDSAYQGQTGDFMKAVTVPSLDKTNYNSGDFYTNVSAAMMTVLKRELTDQDKTNIQTYLRKLVNSQNGDLKVANINEYINEYFSGGDTSIAQDLVNDITSGTITNTTKSEYQDIYNSQDYSVVYSDEINDVDFDLTIEKGEYSIPAINVMAEELYHISTIKGTNVQLEDVQEWFTTNYDPNDETDRMYLANMNDIICSQNVDDLMDCVNGRTKYTGNENYSVDKWDISFSDEEPEYTYRVEQEPKYRQEEQWDLSDSDIKNAMNMWNFLNEHNFEVVTEDQAKSGKWITGMLESGEVVLTEFNPEGVSKMSELSIDNIDNVDLDNIFEIKNTNVAVNVDLQEVSDSIEVKKAEAEYEAKLRRIDKKERKYDIDLAAIENERNAIKQEMETLKTVAKDNVERTFKLFS